MKTLFLLAAVSTAALLFHAQPTCATGFCIQASCVVGSDAVCGTSCYCAASGPGPRGFCVNR